MLVLDHFTQIMLEDIQGFVSMNRAYRMIVWSSHYLEKKKRRGRSRHRIDNSWLPKSRYSKVLRRRLCSVFIVTSRIYRILQTFTTFRKI